MRATGKYPNTARAANQFLTIDFTFQGTFSQ